MSADVRVSRLAVVLVMTLVSCRIALAQERAGEEPDAPDEPGGKVILTPNVGGHSGLITSMVWGAGGLRLYTGGLKDDVAEWDVESGERLRIWRVPGRSISLAYSPTRNQLAVAALVGNPGKASVWLVNVETGEAAHQFVLKGLGCFALAFSPDGERLAVSRQGATEVYNLKAKGKPLVLKETGKPNSLAFDKTGRWLLVAGNVAGVNSGPGEVQLWDLSQESPKPVMPLGARVDNPRAAWTKSGMRVAVMTGGAAPSVSSWSVGEKPSLAWKVEGAALLEALGGTKGAYHPNGITYLQGQVVLASWNLDGRLKFVQINGKTKKVDLFPTDIALQKDLEGGQTAFAGGKWLAATSDPAFRIALYDLKNRKEVRRLGLSVGVPKVVGWTTDSRGVAWGYTPRSDKDWQKGLSVGMDLSQLTRLSRKDLDGAVSAGLPTGWSLQKDASGQVSLVRGGKKTPIAGNGIVPELTRAFTNPKGKMRLIVVNNKGFLNTVNPDTGKVNFRYGKYNQIYDLAVSPDQKYLVVTSAAMSVQIIPLATPGPFLLSILARENGDWVVWTKQGYYAGTPGGEKLIGWKVVVAPDRPALFYPAETFHKRLYRPDLLRKVVELGSVEAAREATAVKERGVEDVLPPKVEVRVEQDAKDKEKVTIHVTAESSAKDQPVEMLRLLVDGRPLPDKQGVKEVPKGEKATAEWTIPKLPGGRLELKVLARCPDVSGVSVPKVVIVPPDGKNRPALHVLAVGINYADKPGLKLSCALNDANALSLAISGACAGKDNLFRQGKDNPPQQLLEEKATTKGVLAALADLRKKKLKPQDLVVFFYAGHGVREGKEFYLLTHDADLKNLAKTALSGRQLREAFTDMPCQVLLLLDACHSGAAAKGLLSGFPAATDAASRRLADEECGVTLLAAAMGYEKAEEKGNNGLFTQGLLKALGKAQTLPHNHHDGRQYVHHLFSYVFDEVKTLSADRQHPFLSLPWTTESFAIRQLTTVVAEAVP